VYRKSGPPKKSMSGVGGVSGQKRRSRKMGEWGLFKSKNMKEEKKDYFND